MAMSDEELDAHRRAADRDLLRLTEEQRRALLARVRGTLAADGQVLTPDEAEVILALARGDLTQEELAAHFCRVPN